ncbi:MULTISPECIES: mechanosensitive ion channel family protein [Hyphomonas]|uniref:mechanosensitive ion channel family protein n=1 Tax=Hyphomonas TaxID=85 RepID=UPI003513E198
MDFNDITLPDVDTSNWPVWLAASWPFIEKWGLVLLACMLVWFVSGLVKKLVVAFGKRVTAKDKSFEGSSWDIASSVARVFALIFLSPLPLGLAGYDWEAIINRRGPGAFAAIAILVIAVLFANWVARSMRKMGNQAHMRHGADDTLFAFSASLLKYVIFAIAIVLALTQLGFPTASLAALLGGAALAIGLALQDTLKAVAAGVMLAIFRPFRIGDYVTLSGMEGEITDITPFRTTFKQIDNKVVSVTNDKVWGDPLVNHTRQTRRRLDLYFDISYDDNMDHALETLLGVANGHPRVLAKDETWVGVHALADWSVRLRLRAFVATPEFVQVRADITKGVKEAFDREGISIPFPHQVNMAYRPPAQHTSEQVSQSDITDTED